MHKYLYLVFLLFFSVQTIDCQRNRQKVEVDQAKLAKSKALIDEGLQEEDRGKQTEKIYKGLEYYREVKMTKEAYLYIGDAFFNKGDLTNASKWYAKAGKENKEATSKKLGNAYLEEAMSSEGRDQKKSLYKASKYLTKAFGTKEANRQIGNEFFDMGSEYYPVALEFYQKGGYEDGVFMIGDLYASKEKDKDKAAETYASTKTKEGFKKAGDLFFKDGDFVKAMQYYAEGGVVEGYIKYAGELKKAGKMNMYNRVSDIIADSLLKQGKEKDVTTMAVSAEKENNYSLAASLYTKLNNTDLANKYNAYDKLSQMNFLEAKEDFQKIGRQDMVEDIDRNMEQLTNLQQIDFNLIEMKNSVPPLNSKINPNTGKTEYDPDDLKAVKTYYSDPKNQKIISEEVYKLSEEYRKLNCNSEMKGIIKSHFMTYRPVSEILDSYNFSKKILPFNITPAAVAF